MSACQRPLDPHPCFAGVDIPNTFCEIGKRSEQCAQLLLKSRLAFQPIAHRHGAFIEEKIVRDRIEQKVDVAYHPA